MIISCFFLPLIFSNNSMNFVTIFSSLLSKNFFNLHTYFLISYVLIEFIKTLISFITKLEFSSKEKISKLFFVSDNNLVLC